jgi:carbon starvation protein
VAHAGAARLPEHIPQDRTIVALAIGIYYVAPPLAMPATTRFIDGSGPVFSGSLFPFLFITIACGSVSGFMR